MTQKHAYFEKLHSLYKRNYLKKKSGEERFLLNLYEISPGREEAVPKYPHDLRGFDQILVTRPASFSVQKGQCAH